MSPASRPTLSALGLQGGTGREPGRSGGRPKCAVPVLEPAASTLPDVPTASPVTDRARPRRSRRPVWTVAAQGRPPPRRRQREYPPRRGRCRWALLLPAPAGPVCEPAGFSSEAGAGEEARPLACPSSYSLQPLQGDRNAAIGSTVSKSRGGRVPPKTRDESSTRSRQRRSSTALTARSASSRAVTLENRLSWHVQPPAEPPGRLPVR
jgi:hypothetical protein